MFVIDNCKLISTANKTRTKKLPDKLKYAFVFYDLTWGSNKPGGESSKVRGRISQGANKPGGERARGERARGESSRGRNGKGAKKPDTMLGWASVSVY